MDKNKKIGLGVLGIIVLVGVFYGGMVYGGTNVRASMMSRGGQTFNPMGGARGARGGIGGGFTAGTILAKDDKSITLQIMGGGSKIIFLDTNTKVSKQTEGSIADLAVGTQVSVTGAANADGSVNAQTVQIRPIMPAGPSMVK